MEKAWLPYVSVFANATLLRIVAMSGLGLRIEDPDAIERTLPSDALNEEVGKAVLCALGDSKLMSPAEFKRSYAVSADLYKKRIDEVMRAHGYRTKRAYFTRMKKCGVEKTSLGLEVTPTRHDQLERFGGLPEKRILITRDASAAEVGAAVRAALERCE